MYHLFLDLLPWCHHAVVHVHCLRFNPTWEQIIKHNRYFRACTGA